MGEAEQAAIGAFLTDVSSTLQGQREEQKRKHDQWISCIMRGDLSAEDCSRILNYDPGEQARVGAESIETRRRAREEQKAQLGRIERGHERAEREIPVSAETVPRLGLDLQPLMRQAKITPEGTTVHLKPEHLALSRELRAREPEEPKPEYGKPPWYVKGLTEKERTKAGKMAAGLEARAGQAKTETDRQYAERISGTPKGERTEFQQGFLDRYEKKTLGLPNLISAYNQAANPMLGGNEDSPRAKFLSRRIAKKLATDEGDISLFVGFDTMQEFKEAFQNSPAYQDYVDRPEVFLDLKNLAEMWYNTYWDEEK